jgi:hypothetical protein
MLRFSYLPSDFHPLVLILGDSEDLRKLAALLRQFAQDTRDVALERMNAAAPSDTSLLITTSAGPAGAHPSAAASKALRWTLTADEAQDFCDAIEILAEDPRGSGSIVLACGSEGEIPVKVSRGEFTEDFLVA